MLKYFLVKNILPVIKAYHTIGQLNCSIRCERKEKLKGNAVKQMKRCGGIKENRNFLIPSFSEQNKRCTKLQRRVGGIYTRAKECFERLQEEADENERESWPVDYWNGGRRWRRRRRFFACNVVVSGTKFLEGMPNPWSSLVRGGEGSYRPKQQAAAYFQCQFFKYSALGVI